MTREEAIELLEDLDGAIEDNHGRDYDEAFRMAIESLSAEPSGDLVSREEAKREIYLLGENPSINDIWNCIDALPSAEYSKPLQTTLNGDLVSREEALDVVCKELQYQDENRIPYDSYDSGTCFGLKKAKELLLALPSAEQTIIGIDIPYGSDKGLATVFKSKDDKLILEKVKEICLDDFADRPTLKQTDTMIIADALRYLAQDTERHEIDRTRAEELREQILQYGASMCSSADRPQVNSAEWVAEKERDFEELNRQNEDSKPQPYIPEASTERVVHCKDCIYSYSRQPEGEKLFVCENRFGMSGWVREDEFCSSGSL